MLTSLKDYQLTYDAILQHDKFIRERAVPLLLNDKLIADSADAGWYYGLGRDRSQRPIIIMSFRKLIDSGIDFENMLDSIDLLGSYMCVNALVPGKVETWHGVIDLKGVGILELPVGSFVSWTKHAKRSYYIRSTTVSFVNTPWVIKKAARIIFSFLDPF